MALKSHWTITELMAMLFEDSQKNSRIYKDVLELIRGNIRFLFIPPVEDKIWTLFADPTVDIETIPILIGAEKTNQFLFDEIFDYMKDNDIQPANAIINVVALMENIEPEDVLEEVEYDGEDDCGNECDSEADKKSLLPLPQGTTWDKVRITLSSAEMVTIYCDKNSGKFIYSQLGMADGRRGDRPKNMWYFFILLLSQNGSVTKENPSSDKKLHDTVKGFKKHMSRTFGIKENCLDNYSPKEGYRARFKTSDATDTSFVDLLDKLPFRK